MDAHEIGDFISSERAERGMTLYRLSKMSGVSIRHLHLIENGRYDVRVSTLQKILTAFDKQLKISDT